MVKECIVKLNNEAVTVVKYGDVDVQLPAIGQEARMVFVSHENGKYFVVDKNYKPKDTSKNKRKSVNKKTTSEEFVKSIEMDNEDNNA